MAENNVTQFPSQDEETSLPTVQELVDGYLELASRHLHQLAELSMKLEQVVTKDGMLNQAVSESTRSARQRTQEAFMWMHQAAATVSALIRAVEEEKES